MLRERAIDTIFLWSTLYLVFSVCKVPWFLIVNFTLSLVIQTSHVKPLYSQSSRCPAKKSTILIWHPEKLPESWLILICHCLRILPYVKHTNCENSRSAATEASILLRSWTNLSIISSKWQMSWILIDWSLFVTTFKSTSKTHLLWKFFGASRNKSKYWYIFDKVLLPVSLQKVKNVKRYGEELRKVLNFTKVTEKHLWRSLFLIKYAKLHA